MSLEQKNGQNQRVGLFARLGWTHTAAGPAELDYVLAPHLFDRELHRQRACADRVNSRFVLLSFGFTNRGVRRNGTDPYAELAKLIQKRARLSDIVGWDGTDKHRIGVILPDTESVAATRFVESVDALFGKDDSNGKAKVPGLFCNVFEYPTAAVARKRGLSGSIAAASNGNGNGNGSAQGSNGH